MCLYVVIYLAIGPIFALARHHMTPTEPDKNRDVHGNERRPAPKVMFYKRNGPNAERPPEPAGIADEIKERIARAIGAAVSTGGTVALLARFVGMQPYCPWTRFSASCVGLRVHRSDGVCASVVIVKDPTCYSPMVGIRQI